MKAYYNIPDGGNCSNTKHFTKISNDFIRNPLISAKAKILLCILLSNDENWHSCMSTIQKMVKEGRDAIYIALNELEQFGYLKRLQVQNKYTKRHQGLFWAYCEEPFQFNYEKQKIQLDKDNLILIDPVTENPVTENPDTANQDLKEDKDKEEQRIREETIVSSSLKRVKKNSSISINLFEKFWEIYPRKDGKGKALKKWTEFCTQKSKEKQRPTWETIKTAIEEQKQSERWQQPQFIPLPATWLNETRWVDDPNEMKTFKKGTEKQINNGSHFSGVKSTFKKSEKL